MEHSFLNELIPIVSYYGLWIVYFGMIAEGTTMVLLTGVLCYMGLLPYNLAIVVAILGAITGDQLWYFLGKYFSKYLFKKSKFLQKKSKKLQPLIEKKGAWFALSSRFIYGGAILFPTTLGTYKFSHKIFTLFDLMGAILWSSIGVSLGYILGKSAESIFGKIEKLEHFILIVLVIILLTWLIKKYLLSKYLHKKDDKG